MKDILLRYEKISGQLINFNKSTTNSPPNTIEANRREVCNQLEVQEIQLLGKYLGMPMSIGKSKKAAFSFLLERVDHKLQGWSNQNLSKVGKVLMLKTATQTVPNFWMSLMLIPVEICEGIERKMNGFGGVMVMLTGV